jgi:hypothetical protein
MHEPRLDGRWRHPDFLKLWAGETISVFGSLVGRTALHFAAILVLHASPLQVALLAATDIVPGLVFGLSASSAAAQIYSVHRGAGLRGRKAGGRR